MRKGKRSVHVELSSPFGNVVVVGVFAELTFRTYSIVHRDDHDGLLMMIMWMGLVREHMQFSIYLRPRF